MNEPRPTYQDILNARDRMKDVVPPSPLIHSSYFSRVLGSEVFLKLENLQDTGSFKIRGAYNHLVQLGEDERNSGVIAASAGNHAQGVAWAAARLGIRATIVMPEDVSIRKLMAVQEYGTEIVLHGKSYDDAREFATKLSGETGKPQVPAFEDARVIAGQGAIGLELEGILEGDVSVIIPVGGGGLAAGIAVATKALHPKTHIIGVQTEHCPSMIRSLEAGEPETVNARLTLADGIAVRRPGDLTFAMVRDEVDEMVAVDEEGIAGAILALLERGGLVAEGAGAAPLAALLEKRVARIPRRVVCILSGGNIEIATIDRILQRGALRMGRLLRVQVNLLDAPGSLWKLSGIVAYHRANILHIRHDRLSLQHPIQVSRVELDLETRGQDHAREILDALTQAGYDSFRVF